MNLPYTQNTPLTHTENFIGLRGSSDRDDEACRACACAQPLSSAPALSSRAARRDAATPRAQQAVQLVGGGQLTVARAAWARPGRGLARTAAAPSTGFGCDKIFGCDKMYIRLRL